MARSLGSAYACILTKLLIYVGVLFKSVTSQLQNKTSVEMYAFCNSSDTFVHCVIRLTDFGPGTNYLGKTAVASKVRIV
jgi:hypothetical protein